MAVIEVAAVFEVHAKPVETPSGCDHCDNDAGPG
jgi:hypothetical protein